MSANPFTSLNCVRTLSHWSEVVTCAAAPAAAAWGELRRCRRLGSFPAAVCGLQLSLLDLADNSLAALPPELGRMTSLRALPLSGNPLRGLRSAQPLSSLLRSLRNRLQARSPLHGSIVPACSMHLSLFASNPA
jgi:Leucine-rich repeat (LRR) protein